jgi:hypothetical protein
VDRVELDVEVWPSASWIVSGASHRFDPLDSGVIVTRPELAMSVSTFAGNRVRSATPLFTCAPSQKRLIGGVTATAQDGGFYFPRARLGYDYKIAGNEIGPSIGQ